MASLVPRSNERRHLFHPTLRFICTATDHLLAILTLSRVSLTDTRFEPGSMCYMNALQVYTNECVMLLYMLTILLLGNASASMVAHIGYAPIAETKKDFEH